MRCEKRRFTREKKGGEISVRECKVTCGEIGAADTKEALGFEILELDIDWFIVRACRAFFLKQ